MQYILPCMNRVFNFKPIKLCVIGQNEVFLKRNVKAVYYLWWVNLRKTMLANPNTICKTNTTDYRGTFQMVT